MNKVFEGKNLEDALEKARCELKLESFLYTKKEVKGGLFKSGSVCVTVVTYEEVLEFAKDYLTTILGNMGISVNFETSIKENQIHIKMYSDNNAILIGKNGQTLSALQIVLRSAVNVKFGVSPYILLDVENYKDKQANNLIRLARNLAREVKQTGREVKLENMNSYERRIVHSALSQNKYVDTISEGEEPNRHVIIRLKD